MPRDICNGPLINQAFRVDASLSAEEQIRSVEMAIVKLLHYNRTTSLADDVRLFTNYRIEAGRLLVEFMKFTNSLSSGNNSHSITTLAEYATLLVMPKALSQEHIESLLVAGSSLIEFWESVLCLVGRDASLETESLDNLVQEAKSALNGSNLGISKTFIGHFLVKSPAWRASFRKTTEINMEQSRIRHLEEMTSDAFKKSSKIAANVTTFQIPLPKWIDPSTLTNIVLLHYYTIVTDRILDIISMKALGFSKDTYLNLLASVEALKKRIIPIHEIQMEERQVVTEVVFDIQKGSHMSIRILAEFELSSIMKKAMAAWHEFANEALHAGMSHCQEPSPYTATAFRDTLVAYASVAETLHIPAFLYHITDQPYHPYPPIPNILDPSSIAITERLFKKSVSAIHETVDSFIMEFSDELERIVHASTLSLETLQTLFVLKSKSHHLRLKDSILQFKKQQDPENGQKVLHQFRLAKVWWLSLSPLLFTKKPLSPVEALDAIILNAGVTLNEIKQHLELKQMDPQLRDAIRKFFSDTEYIQSAKHKQRVMKFVHALESVAQIAGKSKIFASLQKVEEYNVNIELHQDIHFFFDQVLNFEEKERRAIEVREERPSDPELLPVYQAVLLSSKQFIKLTSFFLRAYLSRLSSKRDMNIRQLLDDAELTLKRTIDPLELLPTTNLAIEFLKEFSGASLKKYLTAYAKSSHSLVDFLVSFSLAVPKESLKEKFKKVIADIKDFVNIVGKSHSLEVVVGALQSLVDSIHQIMPVIEKHVKLTL